MKLNEYALRRVDDYFKLQIGNIVLSTPYFTNNAEREFITVLQNTGVNQEVILQVKKNLKERNSGFGIGRGKGTPEEIVDAVYKMSEKTGIKVQNASEFALRNYMNVWGIGIDCSGFMYEVYRYAFSQFGQESEFINSLSWAECNKIGANYSGSFVFDEGASIEIKPDSLQPLDFIALYNKDGKNAHVAFIVRTDQGLMVAQSTPVFENSGVNIHKLSILNGKPEFDFKVTIGTDWEKLYNQGRLIFRRLKILATS